MTANDMLWERAEENLQRELDEGLLTQKEYNAAMRELRRDYQQAARESAQEAYDREMDRW